MSAVKGRLPGGGPRTRYEGHRCNRLRPSLGCNDKQGHAMAQREWYAVRYPIGAAMPKALYSNSRLGLCLPP